MAENLGANFTIDITQLKAGLAQANRLIRESESEFKAAAAGMDDWTKSQAGLEAKVKSLNDITGLQQKKVDALKAEYNRLIAEGLDPTSAKATSLRTDINKETAALEKSKAELAKQTAALDEMRSASDKTEGATEALTDKVKRQQDELDDLKQKYTDLVAEQGDAGDEAKDLARQISDLSGELSENKQKLSDAEKAADELDESLKDVDKTAEDTASGGFTVFKGVISDLASNAIQSLIGSIRGLVGEAVDAADSMAKFEQTMGFAGFDDTTIQQAAADVKEYADRTVYDLNTIANTTAQLAANGVDDYTALTQAAGNLNAVAGGNADTFNSVAMVLTQTAGAGKLTTENWNQLANAIPGASGKIQEALRNAGAYTGDFREAMANGEITAEEFNAALLELGNDPVAVEAATSVSTFEGAMGDLQATAVSGLMEIYDTIGRENITGIINSISGLVGKIIPPIKTAVEWFIKNLPYIETALVGLTAATVTYLGYTTAVQIMTKGWKSLAIAQKAVTAAQQIMNAVMAMNPIGLVVAAIAGLVAAFVMLWNKSEAFREFWISLWENIKEAASAAWTAISEFFTAAWDKVQEIWGGITEFFSGLWESIKTIFSGIAEWINTNVFQPIVEFFQPVITFFTEAWNIIKELAQGCWEAIKIIWGVVSKWVNDTVITPVKTFFTGLWNGIKDAASSAWETIKGVWSAVSGWFNSTIIAPVSNFFSNMWGNLKSGASSAWEGIKSVFSRVSDWFKEVFSKAWQKVKDVFSTGGKIFDGIKDGIVNAFKTVVNAIIRGINKVIAIPFNAINSILDKIKNVSIAGFQPFENLISRLTVPEIPELAKGGVVRKATNAIIGEDGAEAVVPLERNTEWLDKLAAMITDRTGGGVTYNFNQTNNSPKALSRWEIYRQTRNLINAARGV